MEKKKKIAIAILIALLIIFGGLVGGYIYKQNKKEPVKKENTIINIKKATSVTSDSIIILLKEYYYEKGLVNKNNLSYWNVDIVEYIGYYENTSNFIYKVSGSYEYLDKTDSCVYQEQEGNPTNNAYPISIYVMYNFKTKETSLTASINESSEPVKFNSSSN